MHSIPYPEAGSDDEDLPSTSTQPETQGENPLTAELGEQGEGDLSPEDI